jgi:hypothetical protein
MRTAGLLLAILAPAAGGILSAAAGRDVIVISPHSPEMVEMNRILWSPGEDVASIYGIPHGRMRVLFAPSFSPAEEPSLRLAPRGGLQAKTLWFAVRWATLAGILLALAGFLFRRSRDAPRAP